MGVTTTPTPEVEADAATVPAAMSPGALRAIVVVAGMTTMATEMSASRLLAPYFGASVMVWANIIGLILIYLSVGYWWGGRVADRHPHARGLCTLTLAAAVTIALVPFVARPVLAASAGSIDAGEVGTVLGSFIGSLLLFSVPITLLGMVPPYAVRLAMHDVERSGEVSGTLYALSTIGSIVGTFGSVLVLIPGVGTRRTMLAFALALALLSLAGLGARSRIGLGGVALLAALLLVPAGLVKASSGGRVLFEGESRYQFVQVVEEEGGERRLLQLNEGWAVHSVYDPHDRIVGGVWDHFLVLPALAEMREPDGPAATPDVLIVGNAAGTAARAYARYRPEAHVDGVEIDPLVTSVGRRYFGMRDLPNLDVHTADGRPFLLHSNDRWDVIHIDAYRQPYIPFYLTTREFFDLARGHLNPGGVVSINVGSAPGDDRILRAVAATMRSEFPTVHRYGAEDYNDLVVASERAVSPDELAARIRASDFHQLDGELYGLFERFAAGLVEVEPDPGIVLTDDHAPVEWMTDRMIAGAARGGGSS